MIYHRKVKCVPCNQALGTLIGEKALSHDCVVCAGIFKGFGSVLYANGMDDTEYLIVIG